MSSPHQDGICTCLIHHSIQSVACLWEGFASLGIDGGWVMLISLASSSHLGAHWGGFFSMQEFLEVGLQWWRIFEIHIPLTQDGPSFFSLPHWWGQLVGHICIGVMFWVLLWGGCSLFGKCHLTSLPGGTYMTGSVLEQYSFGMGLPGASIGVGRN